MGFCGGPGSPESQGRKRQQPPRPHHHEDAAGPGRTWEPQTPGRGELCGKKPIFLKKGPPPEQENKRPGAQRWGQAPTWRHPGGDG